MDWLQIARDGGGWLVAVAMATAFARALLKGDLVLGREYQYIVKTLDETSEKAEQLAQEQRSAAAEERKMMLERIDAHTRMIDSLQRSLSLQIAGQGESR